MKKSKNKRVIPGFGLSFGITITMLGLIVIIPLCSLAIFSAKLSPSEFIQTITRPRVLSSYAVSFFTAFVAAAIDAVMGMIIAWVLVRYDFPGKAIMDGIIELPFALPTAVAGIALTHLTTTQGWVGAFFQKFGIKIAYTTLTSQRPTPTSPMESHAVQTKSPMTLTLSRAPCQLSSAARG